jgi:uncharacterized protein
MLDLRAMDIAPGAARVVDVRVPQDPLRMGGETYRIEPSDPLARVEVQAAQGGLYLKLGLSAQVCGPCVRCLDDACVTVRVDASEYHERDGAGELSSDYVADGLVDVHRWARDAIVLDLPDKILCAPDCAGLCARCGERLASGGAHECGEEEADPRWEKLRRWGA